MFLLDMRLKIMSRFMHRNLERLWPEVMSVNLINSFVCRRFPFSSSLYCDLRSKLAAVYDSRSLYTWRTVKGTITFVVIIIIVVNSWRNIDDCSESSNTATGTPAAASTTPSAEQAMMMLSLIRQMTGANLVIFALFCFSPYFIVNLRIDQ